MKLINKLFDKKHLKITISYLLIIFIYVLVTVLINTGSISSLLKSLIIPCCCYIVAALSLNLCVGISGELSLGHAAFMCIGAFTSVCLSGYLASVVTNAILRLIICIVAGSLFAAIFGYLISIPVLRLKGDYLAIVTLAFCQIVKSLFNNIYLGFDKNGFQISFITNKLSLDGGKMLISGPMGATATKRIADINVAFILVIITLTIIYNLINSKNGRAIMAGRDNAIAASSVGINITKYKTLAFVISAALVGAAGALYALNYSTLIPAKFDYNTSILILVYVVLGGLGNINGTIIATIVLYVLPEMLRSLQDYRMLIYAIILILIMLVTNNPTIKTLIKKLSPFKKEKKGSEE